MGTRRLGLRCLLPLLFAAATGLLVGAEEHEGVPVVPLASRYEALATLEVSAEEISALAPLPASTAERRLFLAVTDEGAWDPDEDAVTGALYHLEVEVGAGPAPTVAPPRPVGLYLAGRLPRIDPSWEGAASPLDLEGIAPLPGAPDLYLLSGERNPEDRTDDGANRLYLVRYPAGAEDRAVVVAYFRLHDLPDDLLNDRFEGIVLLPMRGQGAPGWWFYGFKERTAFPGRAPAHVRGALRRTPDGFDLTMRGDRGFPPLLPEHLEADPARISSQADACAAPDGTVWVLDRWRRQVHVAASHVETGRLRRFEALDFHDLVSAIPGEQSALEPAPPGLEERRGYGRHEAICFDAFGWLYLAADRGGGRPSTLTVLAPAGTDPR